MIMETRAAGFHALLPFPEQDRAPVTLLHLQLQQTCHNALWLLTLESPMYLLLFSVGKIMISRVGEEKDTSLNPSSSINEICEYSQFP